MARALLICEARDSSGVVDPSASIRIYNLGTTTPYSGLLYAAASGGVALTQPLTPDSLGRLFVYTALPDRVSVSINGAASVVGQFFPDSANTVTTDGSGNATIAGTLTAAGLSVSGTLALTNALGALISTGVDGGDSPLPADSGSISYSARAHSQDTAHRVRIMHGSQDLPFVNNNGGVNYPSTPGDFYGPKSTFVVMSRQRPVSNNCTPLPETPPVAPALHSAGFGNIDETLWEFLFDSKVTGDIDGNAPMGISGIYGLVGRAYSDVAMGHLPNCKHGSTYAAVSSYDHNALTGIGRVCGFSNAGMRAGYLEATLNASAANAPKALAIGLEVTGRQGPDTAPGDDAPRFDLATLGPRYIYGIADELGREVGAGGKYGTVALYVAGEGASLDGAWNDGIILGRRSAKYVGIDASWMKTLTYGGDLPSLGVLRLPYGAGITSLNSDDSGTVDLLRMDTVSAAPNILVLRNGVVVVSSTAATVNGDFNVLGGVNVSGTARRIIGDFTNATVGSRAMFQTSTANSPTSLGIIPSGTGTTANIIAYNNATPASATITSTLEANATDGRISVAGGVPFKLFTNATEQIRIGTDGVLDFRNSQSATGSGGSATTTRTLGNGTTTGPGTAAQSDWLKVFIGGVARWIPLWT